MDINWNIDSIGYCNQVGKAKQDNKSKDEHIKFMEGTIQSLELKNKSKDVLNRNLQDRVYNCSFQLLFFTSVVY
jgi:kinesin family member C2/C3